MLSRFRAAPMAVQLAALTLVALATLHLSMTSALWLLGPGRGGAPDFPGDPVLHGTVALLDASPAADRPALITALARAHPGMGLGLVEAPAPDLPRERHGGPGGSGRLLVRGPTPGHLTLQLADGTWIGATMPPPPGTNFIYSVFVGSISFVFLTFAALFLWASQTLIRPLRDFVARAEAFSVDEDPERLRVTGPAEVRTAVAAFNRLQDRVQGMVADRTRMLAAIGHDLRTPLTRMRLRAEFVDDEELREALTRDIAQMEAMTAGALAFLRDGQRQSAGALTDLTSLVQTVCDEFADTGRDVTFADAAPVAGLVQAEDVSRAVANLVDNAVKFGTRARVSLTGMGAGGAAITVDDDGPGIPPDLHDRVLRPFEKGDEARPMGAQEGFGLGLSIAQGVAEAHGGTLGLANRSQGGLRVTMTLRWRQASP